MNKLEPVYTRENDAVPSRKYTEVVLIIKKTAKLFQKETTTSMEHDFITFFSLGTYFYNLGIYLKEFKSQPTTNVGRGTLQRTPSNWLEKNQMFSIF